MWNFWTVELIWMFGITNVHNSRYLRNCTVEMINIGWDWQLLLRMEVRWKWFLELWTNIRRTNNSWRTKISNRLINILLYLDRYYVNLATGSHFIDRSFNVFLSKCLLFTNFCPQHRTRISRHHVFPISVGIYFGRSFLLVLPYIPQGILCQMTANFLRSVVSAVCCLSVTGSDLFKLHV